ncbi:MAG TPA: hypothetical protein VIZ28_05170 [Chitinophagaceae bacterium]
MKLTITFSGLVIITALLFGCKNKVQKKTGQQQVASLTAFDLDERLKTADSLLVVFYKDPYGTDSLRYTRYYKQASVTDTKEITVLQQQLAQSFAEQEKLRNCRSEGKIWCFTKGKIFQTLYFSTRCDDCCHFYLIKDGNFYYSKIMSSTTVWLELLKPLAIEPVNKGDL